MSTNITEFNRQLKKYFEDVRIIEKTSPSKAPDFWLHICKYIIDFAKTPNCPRSMRKSMTLQAEAILNKVKRLKSGEISSVLNSELEKEPKPVKKAITKLDTAPAVENKGTKVNLSEDEMMDELLDLPSIPSEMESPEAPTVDIAPSPGGPDELHPAGDEAAQQGTILLSPESKSLLTHEKLNLDELEEELKKMPSNLKEISPSDYENQTIVPPSGTSGTNIDLAEYKSDTEVLDITTQNQPPLADQLANKTKPTSANSKSGTGEPMFKISGPPPQDTAEEEPKDIFTAPELDKTTAGDATARICFACGEPLEPSQVICPRCRAENSLQ